MMHYAQAQYLRRLEMESPSLRLDFELAPVRLNPETRRLDSISVDSKRDASGILHFQERDSFKIRITNLGDKSAYFTLLDIQPDNGINVLVPGEKETPAEFRVSPGQTVELPNFFQVAPPAGVEMFKLISTDKPVDLRPLAHSRGVATRSNLRQNPLEKLFAQTYFNEDCLLRGGQTTNLGAGAIHVHSFTFIIDQK